MEIGFAILLKLERNTTLRTALVKYVFINWSKARNTSVCRLCPLAKCTRPDVNSITWHFILKLKRDSKNTGIVRWATGVRCLHGEHITLGVLGVLNAIPVSMSQWYTCFVHFQRKGFVANQPQIMVCFVNKESLNIWRCCKNRVVQLLSFIK